MRLRSLAFALVLVAACGGDDGGPDGPPAACNPLGGTTCLLPWPSAAFLKEDAASATGFRLDLDAAGMPVNADGIVLEPGVFNRWDGFSPSAPIVVAFDGGIGGDGLPPPDDPARSLAADSPIVLLDMDRMERAPFFAEIDQNVTKAEERTLIIRPLVRLKPKTRYAVGLRKSLRSAAGGELVSPPAFVAVRDGTRFDHPRLHRDRFDAVFTALAAEGVAKDELVLAWDFVTASDEFLTADLTQMRDEAVTAIGTAGANLTFEATERESNPTLISKAYLGTFTSPDYLTDGERDSSVMRRDADGRPLRMGMRDATFAALVPKCAETATGPLPVIVFGHGLFGSAADYLDDGFLHKVAEQFCFVVVAGDFIGLTKRQLDVALLAANDLNKGGAIAEKLAQSVVDFIALENLVRGPLRASPLFKQGYTADGAELIDASKVYYLGGSLGGIMGNVFMAYDPNILRGALGVPGGAWTMLFERSVAWTPLKIAAQGSYTDPLEYQLLILFLGMRLEPYDPITTASRVVADPLPGTPAKQILIYEAIGDCLVSNYSTEMVVRTMGLTLTTPSVKTPWGIPVQGATDELTSGFTIYDEQPRPLPPTVTNVQPADDNGTHSGVNKRQAVLDQVREFVLNGRITQTCKMGDEPAACDCSTGACGDRI